MTSDLSSFGPPGEDLRARSIRGALTRFASQFAHILLGLAATAILARMLAPSDFGLIAMVVAVTAFLGLFRDMGLSSVTVQRDQLTGADLNGLFWINALLGVALGAALAVGAPLVAWFYGVPELAGVTVALSLGFVVAGLSVQHSALLQRHMRFGSVAAIELGSQAAGLVAAVISARHEAGYWALVVFQLTQHVVALAAAWIVCGWRPGWPAVAGVRSLVSFGAGLTTFNVLAFATRNLDNVLLGHSAGAGALGIYTKAYALVLLPVDRIRGPVASVVVPALSRLQKDPDRFRNYFLTAIATVAAAGMPLVVFLFVFADEAIRLVLGPQWQDAGLLFRILAPAAFVETFNVVGSWVCVPLGRAGRLVRWQLFATAFTVVAFLIGVQWGAIGMAVAVSLSTVTLRPIAAWYLLRGAPVRVTELAAALCSPACASIVSGLLVFGTSQAMPEFGRLFRLPAMAALYAVTYLVLLFTLPGAQRLRQLVVVIREWMPFPAPAMLGINDGKREVSG